MNEGNHHKRMGFGYEGRFVKARKKEGARRAIRHYGSLGVMDVEWTDAMGFNNEAQLKFSSKKQPKVTSKERAKIVEYAKTKEGTGIKIWIICKLAFKPEIWELMN